MSAPTTRTRLAEARQAALSALAPASHALRLATRLIGRLRRKDDEREARKQAEAEHARKQSYAKAHAAVARWGGTRDATPLPEGRSGSLERRSDASE